MGTIANDVALAMVAANEAVLVDVREPAEYWEGHLPGALNLPTSDFNVEAFRELGDRTICLVCRTGNRTGWVAGTLRKHGFDNVVELENHMASLDSAEVCEPPSGMWSIDRQFRMTLGVLLAIFLLGYFAWSPYFLIIPIILATGLIVTSIIDRCYLRMGIAMLPWNRKRAEELSARRQELVA